MKKYLFIILCSSIILCGFSQTQIGISHKIIKEKQKVIQLQVTYSNKTDMDFLVPEIEPCTPYGEKFLGNNCLLCFTIKTFSKGDTTTIYPSSQASFHQFVKEPTKSNKTKPDKKSKENYIVIKSNSEILKKYNISLKGFNYKNDGTYLLQLEYYSCKSVNGEMAPTGRKVFSESVELPRK